MRVFIGISFSLQQQDILEQRQEIVLDNYGDSFADTVRTHKNDFHITVRFLGEVTSGEAQFFATQIQKQMLPKEFEITCNDVLYLPSVNQAKYISLSCEPSESLNYLFNLVYGISSGYGPKHQLSYVPHITIARFNSPPVALPPYISCRALNILCDNVTIYKSGHRGDVSDYRSIFKFDLLNNTAA